VAFAINTNVASLQAQNSLRITGDLQSKTINRVTSGLRIVASGDDAAGLAIANTYRSDGAVLAQGVRNANDGLSQLQTADGGINNISQLLDRARTLATQSASGAFTGDRSVLNSEFQSVIGEIDRQAQAVGLNQGGQFAKALSVFIGGGQSSNGVSATTNGSIALDLSQSTVDSASLGLKGVQAVGVAGTDIGSGSAATSLSTILANSTNAGSVATPGFTTFVVKGPGFDGNGVKLSVNTANLGGTSDLAAAVNAAISAAGNGGTQQATAFKNANVLASVQTDSTGKQQLVFKSSTTAFQVEAGDRQANALLGNFERNAVVTASDTAAFADTSTNHTLSFKIDGGSTINVSTITSAAGTSKGQIVKDLNADATFSAAATASLQGNQLVIKSKGNSATSSVEVVTTTLGTAVGLTAGVTGAAAASTGAALNVQVQGGSTVDARANIIGTDTNATRSVTSTTNKVKITVNGTSGTLTLVQGTTLTKGQLVADINHEIGLDGGLNGNVTAKLVNNQVVFEATKQGQTLSLDTVANDAYTALGITAGTSSSTHKAVTSDTITLRFQGSGLTSPVDVTLNGTTAGTTTTADVLADLQTKISTSSALAGAGITLSTSAVGNNLVFTSNKGEQFQVTATGDNSNLLGLGSFAAGSNSAVDYTNITAGSTYVNTGAGGTASFEASLNGSSSSSNTFSADLSAGDATAATQTTTVGYTAGVVVLTGAAATLDLRVNGGATFTANLGSSATTTISSILTAINSAYTTAGYSGTLASLDGSGNLTLTSGTKGSNSSVEVAASTDAVYITKLGLTASTPTVGTNASEANVLQQLNSSIAANSTLVKAGLQAVDNGGGKIQITSTNSTFFRLNASGTGNAGFTHVGTTFAGNTQGAAPATSPYFDSQGADASASLAYSDRLYGNDDQTIGITASDSNGTKHALSVNLANDGSARSQSIDQALSTINSALQQSNDATLSRLVAVKEESGGTQSIKFLSTVRGFQVSVSSDPNSTGITPPTANVNTATTVGSGANADINDVSSAQSAVAGLATAVSLLGKAQAVVGRGQNQFTFAINLAQSQLTNLAAAESRIRDADLAAESANLTKSQILLQAGIAALAQANSAPQQVLSLLRG
jgi:flagellin